MDTAITKLKVLNSKGDIPSAQSSAMSLSKALIIMRQFMRERHHLDSMCHALYVRPTTTMQAHTNCVADAVLGTVALQARRANLDLLVAILRYPNLRYYICRLAHLFEVALATRPPPTEPALPAWIKFSNADEAKLAEKRHQELIDMQKNMLPSLPEYNKKASRILFHPNKVQPIQLDTEKMTWVLEQMRDLFHALALDKDIQPSLRKMLKLLGNLPETIAEHMIIPMDDERRRPGRNGGVTDIRKHTSQSNGIKNNGGENSQGSQKSNSQSKSTSNGPSHGENNSLPNSATSTATMPTTLPREDLLLKIFPRWDVLMQEVQNIVLSTRNDETFRYYATQFFRVINESMTNPEYTQNSEYMLIISYCLENMLRLLWLPRYQGPIMRLMPSMVALADQLWLNGGRTEVSLAFEDGLAAMVNVLHQHRAEVLSTTTAVAPTVAGREESETTDQDRGHVSHPVTTSRSLFSIVSLVETAIAQAGLAKQPVYLPSIDWQNNDSELILDNICLEFPETNAHRMSISSHVTHSTDESPRWTISMHGIAVNIRNMRYYYQTKSLAGRRTRDLGECHVLIPSQGLHLDLILSLGSLPEIDPTLISALRNSRAQIWDRLLIAEGVLHDLFLETSSRDTAKLSPHPIYARPYATTASAHELKQQSLHVSVTRPIEHQLTIWLRRLLYPNWTPSIQQPQFFSPFRTMHLQLPPKKPLNNGCSRRTSSVRVTRAASSISNSQVDTRSPVMVGSPHQGTTAHHTVSRAAVANGSNGGNGSHHARSSMGAETFEQKASTSYPSLVSPAGLSYQSSQRVAATSMTPTTASGPTPKGATSATRTAGVAVALSLKSAQGIELVKIESCKVHVCQIKLDLVESRNMLSNLMMRPLLEFRIRKIIEDHLHQMFVDLVQAVNAGVTEVVRAAEAMEHEYAAAHSGVNCNQRSASK
ncbi:hypothetical protein BGW42_002018 [Actinomortierella wolfii]|nr:hypothetical protein BGW42_002018 [Actinomortierella wolfii]